MILSKPVGTLYGHNLMWHRFWKFTVFLKRKKKPNKNETPPKQQESSYLFWGDLIFVSFSAFCCYRIWQASSAFTLSTAFMIFVNHHICSLPAIFLQIEELQSLQSFLTRQLLFLLDNFLSFSVLFLTHVLLEMHRTAHNVPPSLLSTDIYTWWQNDALCLVLSALSDDGQYFAILAVTAQ